ncbi:MAG: hypothetical protein HZB51_32770 [Chloroflexi bacterium]|nr:hypothetical protein [Chloroflexota bacterium]
MSTVSVRIPIGAEGTCPRCKQMDATQKVSVITHAFANALTPAEFEAISFSRSRGEITDWASPRGTLWEIVTKQLALPERPVKPWSLRFAMTSQRDQWLFAIVLFALSFFLFSRLPLPDVVRLFAPFIITFGTVGGLGSYGRKKQKEYDTELIAWGAIKSKWSGLRYCARDNIVFIIGQELVLQPDQVQAFLKSH